MFSGIGRVQQLLSNEFLKCISMNLLNELIVLDREPQHA